MLTDMLRGRRLLHPSAAVRRQFRLHGPTSEALRQTDALSSYCSSRLPFIAIDDATIAPRKESLVENMYFSRYLQAACLFAVCALAASPQKQVFITFPKDTPTSELDAQRERITTAVSHYPSLLLHECIDVYLSRVEKSCTSTT